MSAQDRNHPPIVEQIASRTGQQIREVADQIGDTAIRANDGLAHGLGRIEMKFKDVRDAIVDKTKEYSKKTDRAVSKNPWVAMGITAGFAFMAGLLVGRRR